VGSIANMCIPNYSQLDTVLDPNGYRTNLWPIQTIQIELDAETSNPLEMLGAGSEPDSTGFVLFPASARTYEGDALRPMEGNEHREGRRRSPVGPSRREGSS
jgi:hypothetical protein